MASPVLELEAAESFDVDEVSRPCSLRLERGDFALIESHDLRAGTTFADLCMGMVPLRAGRVRFLGFDWATMSYDHAAARRGRIGRVFADGGWVGRLSVADNILLGPLHHTHHSVATLHEAALGLALGFGLPGLPLGRPGETHPADLARAGLVRALLCDPLLLLLESPIQVELVDLVPPLLRAIASRRDRGTAVIWLTRSEANWRDHSIPATQRLHLIDGSLVPARRAA